MDASAILKKQGWPGLGHSLNPSSSNTGLKKPLLISHKTNVLGLGLDKNAALSDQWWMRAFDSSLKTLGTGTVGVLGSVREHGVKRGGLYGRFVRGEEVGATFGVVEVKGLEGVGEGGAVGGVGAGLVVDSSDDSSDSDSSDDDEDTNAAKHSEKGQSYKAEAEDVATGSKSKKRKAEEATTVAPSKKSKKQKAILKSEKVIHNTPASVKPSKPISKSSKKSSETKIKHTKTQDVPQHAAIIDTKTREQIKASRKHRIDNTETSAANSSLESSARFRALKTDEARKRMRKGFLRLDSEKRARYQERAVEKGMALPEYYVYRTLKNEKEAGRVS